jgi:hypothetical protein
VRLNEEAFSYRAIELPNKYRFEKGGGVGCAEPSEVQLRDALEINDDLASREEEPDGVRAETPRDEREGSSRLGVEPLRVVDHAHDRLCRSGLGHEIERRESHDVSIGSVPTDSPNATRSASDCGCGNALTGSVIDRQIW